MHKVVTALSIAFMLAAFGCTTNENPGNGEPTNEPMLTPVSTPGSSSGTSFTPPMASSSYGLVTPSERAAASVDAVAVLAADQGYRGRVLGAADPGPGPVGVASGVAQPINPAPLVNPGVTVNSTITSPGTPAITGGPIGGSDAGVLFTAPATLGATTAAMTATTGTTAPIAGVNSQGAIPASSATAPVIGTTSQMANPAASATVPVVPAATATATTATAAKPTVTTTTTMTGALNAPAKRGVARGSLRVPAASSTAAPIQILTNANGAITVTNVKQ